MAQSVLDKFGSVYKELSESSEFIIRVISLEEDRFANTSEQGNAILQDMIAFRKALWDLCEGKITAQDIADTGADIGW